MTDQHIPDILADEDAEDLVEYHRGFAKHGVPYKAYVERTADQDIEEYETSYLPFLLPWLENKKAYEIEEFWEGHDDHGETYRVYADYVNDTDVQNYVNAFSGVWESKEAFAMERGPELLNIPAKAGSYLDSEKLLEALSADWYIANVARGVAVYWAH